MAECSISEYQTTHSVLWLVIDNRRQIDVTVETDTCIAGLFNVEQPQQHNGDFNSSRSECFRSSLLRVRPPSRAICQRISEKLMLWLFSVNLSLCSSSSFLPDSGVLVFRLTWMSGAFLAFGARAHDPDYGYDRGGG